MARECTDVSLRQRETALAVLAERIYGVPRLLACKTHMPAPAGPRFLSHVVEALEDQYPKG
jgi:hypothetical protein